MSCYSRKVIEKQLILENKIYYDEKCDQCVFSKCRNVKPKSLCIDAEQTKCNQQVGFFDTDSEVYFDEIVLKHGASFSNIVRNYWWNGKEESEKKEGYYSLIKSVKKLQIGKQHINNLIDYMEGRYEAGKHWQLHKLDRNMKVKIDNWSERLEETTVERLQKHFDNTWSNEITANLKTENNITCNCDLYEFKSENYERVVPKKLIVNATVEKICFRNIFFNVHIPDIVMEEKADFKSIIYNYYTMYLHGKHYSLLPHAKTLVIRNNPKVLCDLMDYVNGKYKISNENGDNLSRIISINSYSRYNLSKYGDYNYPDHFFGDDDDDNWKLHQLNKNMTIVIERPGIAFVVVKEISDYFTDVLVDNNKPQEYLAKQEPYQKSFQEYFDKYDLKTNQIGNFISAGQELQLEGGKFNVGGSSRRINELCVNQEIEQKQFVCFHDTNKPVVINSIIIRDGGDLQCVLQNAYYNGTDSGFFSLLRTAKELEIYSNHDGDNQVLIDLVDYIEGEYTLNANWKQEELDKDMKININSGRYGLSLSVIQQFRNYFRDVSIDRIYTPLDTENVIDQECEDKYIFADSRNANPQKLVINANLMGSGTLILFNQADGEVHIPETTIDVQGCFAAIVRNWWENNKEGEEYKCGNYSLVQHAETLIIRNNPKALEDFADYVLRKYEIEKNKRESHWKLQQLNRNIKVVIQGPGNAFLPVLRIYNYFNEVTVDGKQPENYLATWELWNNPNYKTFRTCFGVHRLLVEPCQYGIEFQKYLQLISCVYNIKKSVARIDSLDVRQKLDINQFVCFHDINKPLTVDTIEIDDVGDLRNVLQNAYYKKSKAGFFSLLKTAKRLEISNNEQAVEDLADYVDGKYTLHPKWERYTLDRNMKIQLSHDSRSFSLDIAKRLRKYFKNVSIDAIKALLETENIINQECENKYIFTNCRDVNPQKLVVNAKLTGSWGLIKFSGANGEVYIPDITIGEHGCFDAIVRNLWQNCKSGNEEKYGYYSLVSHVETLTIQNNPEAIRDLDSYISGNYKIEQGYWKAQKLNKNIIVRINCVKGLNKQINRLRDYFGYVVINDRKALGTQRREAIANIKLDDNKIQRRSTANADKHNTIAQADAEIAETRRRIEKTRARLGRRRMRFQEYLALTE